MSLKLMSQVWEHPHLTNPTDKLALLALADWANDDGVCYPRMSTLADKISVTKDTAKELVALFQAHGYLTILQRGQGRGHANVYRIHPEKGRPIQRPEKKRGCQKPPFGNVLSDAEKGVPETPFPAPPYKVNQFNSNEPSERDARAQTATVAQSPNPHAVTHTDSSKQKSEAPPTPQSSGAAPGYERGPFVQGNDADPRFHSPHFKAVCETCVINPNALQWWDKVKVAGAAIDLADHYTAEQISLVGQRWPKDKSAPTLSQLRLRIEAMSKDTPVAPEQPAYRNRQQTNADNWAFITADIEANARAAGLIPNYSEEAPDALARL